MKPLEHSPHCSFLRPCMVEQVIVTMVHPKLRHAYFIILLVSFKDNQPRRPGSTMPNSLELERLSL